MSGGRESIKYSGFNVVGIGTAQRIAWCLWEACPNPALYALQNRKQRSLKGLEGGTSQTPIPLGESAFMR